MAKSNKLEKSQLDQINKLDEGLFSPIWKKILGGRLKRQLRKLERDPAMRDALKRLDQSLEDFERELEVGNKIISATSPKDMGPVEKNTRDFLKKLGYKGV